MIKLVMAKTTTTKLDTFRLIVHENGRIRISPVHRGVPIPQKLKPCQLIWGR